MNCFECAKTHDSLPAVGLCKHCQVGLCLDHLIEAHAHRVGGTTYGCPHRIPNVRPSLSAAGIAAADRHAVAAAA